MTVLQLKKPGVDVTQDERRSLPFWETGTTTFDLAQG